MIGLKLGSWRDICTHMFITASFIIAKRYKQHKYPSGNEWIKNMWYTDTMEYYLAIKKEENPLFKPQHEWTLKAHV